MARPKGFLYSDIDRVLKGITTGEIQVVEGDMPYYTPYHIARLLRAVDGLESTEGPSAGAVAAVFKKMEDSGYATFRRLPYAFLEFTDHARNLGVEKVVGEYKEPVKVNVRKHERRERKKAEKARELFHEKNRVPNPADPELLDFL